MEMILRLILGLNYMSATYPEGCHYIRRYEENNNIHLINWTATDDALLSGLMNPERDGWQGLILCDDSVIEFDGNRWYQAQVIT